MSQMYLADSGSLPTIPNIQFIEGNDSVAVPPDPGTHILYLIGDSAQGVTLSGNAGTYTETITVQNASTSVKGVASYNSNDFSVSSGVVSLKNSVHNTAQTIGAVTADLITVALGATPGVYTFDCRIAGFDSATPSGAGYTIVGSVRTDGASATLLSGQAVDSFEEATTAACAGSLVVSGNNAIFRVLGALGLTINWTGNVQYIFQG